MILETDGSPAPTAARAIHEADLLARYAVGDAAAAQQLITALGPRLLGYCRRMLGGDLAEAEDVVQEVMLRLWRLAPTWVAGQAQVSTWAFGVASNLCIDRLRRPARRSVNLADAPEPVSGLVPADAVILSRQRQTALDKALAQLPERQRQAVVLRHIEGLANPEIAAIMGLGIEAVESLTARGRRALQAELADRRATLGFHDEEVHDV